MEQTKIREYVERYFQAHQSRFVENHPAYITVELPMEVDKDLGNRPFYWTYVERCGIEPNKLMLTFIFDKEKAPEGLRGEWIGFGTGRLQQIFQSAVKHGRFVRLYEEEAAEHAGGAKMPPLPIKALLSPHSAPLIPWLGINYKVEFVCDQKRDLLLHPGVNLITGQVVPDFYEKVCSLRLTPKLPDYRFTMQPFYSLGQAVAQAESYVRAVVDREDQRWAENARERLEQEIAIVESFFRRPVGDEEDGGGIVRIKNGDESENSGTGKREEQGSSAELQKQIEELKWQFQPRIQVKLINTGVFYLRSLS